MQIRPRRVLVCGGRDFTDEQLVCLTFAAFEIGPGDIIVHGDGDGTDMVCARIARELGTDVEAHPIDWDAHGNAGSQIRNREMAESDVDLCLAFPGSQEASSCLEAAKKAGVPVYQVSRVPIVDRRETPPQQAHPRRR